MLVRMKWTAGRRKPNWNRNGNSDHVIVAENRVTTGERRAWRKEKVANEEIGTELRVGQPDRTQRRGRGKSRFQASRNSSEGSEESERTVQ